MSLSLDPIRPDRATDRQRPATRRPTTEREGRAQPTADLAAFLQQRLGNRGVQRLVQANPGVSEPGRPQDALLALQGSIGNQAVGRMFRAHQNAAGERPTPIAQHVQRAINAQRADGEPLQGALLREMEAVLGTDLDGVRLHTGAAADELVSGQDARAFAQGHDVFLRSDLDPATDEGRESLAHELAHVVRGAPTAGAVMREPDMARTSSAPSPDLRLRANALIAEAERTAEDVIAFQERATAEMGRVHKQVVAYLSTYRRAHVRVMTDLGKAKADAERRDAMLGAVKGVVVGTGVGVVLPKLIEGYRKCVRSASSMS